MSRAPVHSWFLRSAHAAVGVRLAHAAVGVRLAHAAVGVRLVQVAVALLLAGCATAPAFSLREVGESIIPAAQWGGTPADPARATRHKVTRITLHHQGQAFPRERDPAEYLRSLQKWSRNVRNWLDIPYHYVIDLDGRIYEGRAIDFAGDTNTEYDPRGHALVEVVGNFEEVEPNEAQLQAVVRVMSWLAAMHRVPEEAIASHRDYAGNTLCPGRNLYRYVENGWFRERVRETLARQRP